MAITYTVAIDYDDDGVFTGPGEDISADVLALRWRLGMAAPYDSVAAPVEAQITVRNLSRAYSPEYTVNDLKPGKPLRIQTNDGVTTRTHFTGFIQRVEPLAGSLGARTAIIYAGGPEAALSQNRVRLPPQINVTADQVIAAILNSVPFRRTPLKGYWLLNQTGRAELGTNTRLSGIGHPSTLEYGQSIFAYVADTWFAGLTGADAIRQLAESERGRFFIDRSGQIVFYNRHHTLKDTTADATFADNMAGLDYAYGADVVNRVQVRITPRSSGTPGTVLWTLASPITLTPGEDGVREIVAVYRDSHERPMGALSLIAPVAGTDYNANTLANGLGINRTAKVSVTVLSADASAARLQIRNNSAQTFYLLAGMQLRGTPLNQGDPLVIEQTDHVSMNLYGLNTLLFDLPALTSVDEAGQIAGYEIARRKTPSGRVRSIQVSTANLLTQVLARTLFDRISVQETQTNHSADYFIIAEQHEVDLGGFSHHVTWTLESADANAFWLLGTSTLDQTTLVAY
jgi:hypothetical protein